MLAFCRAQAALADHARRAAPSSAAAAVLPPPPGRHEPPPSAQEARSAPMVAAPGASACRAAGRHAVWSLTHGHGAQSAMRGSEPARICQPAPWPQAVSRHGLVARRGGPPPGGRAARGAGCVRASHWFQGRHSRARSAHLEHVHGLLTASCASVAHPTTSWDGAHIGRRVEEERFCDVASMPARWPGAITASAGARCRHDSCRIAAVQLSPLGGSD